MFCTEHKKFFHAEIEDCPDCRRKQQECPHENRGPSRLFGGREYAGLAGLWDECYDCGGLVKYESSEGTDGKQ